MALRFDRRGCRGASRELESFARGGAVSVSSEATGRRGRGTASMGPDVDHQWKRIGSRDTAASDVQRGMRAIGGRLAPLAPGARSQ